VLIRVIVGVDDESLRDRVCRLIGGIDVLRVVSGTQADAAVQMSLVNCDLAFIEWRSTGDGFRAFLDKVAALPDHPQLIAVLRQDEAHARAQLLAQGVLTILDASLPDETLRPALTQLVTQRREAQRRHLELHRHVSPEPLISESAAMRRVVDTAHRVARADSAVLLLGETGVGKERLAELIHTASPRSAKPFVAVNCAALPAELFESELFGHEKGAFTGASRARRGRFELAHEGSLFLDEVGDVPIALQAKLLRALQERRITPLGSERAVEVDVRVISATNRDIGHEMAVGNFRRDLYYRLGVVEIAIPPLRERGADIPAMANSFVHRYASQMNRDVEGFEPETMDALLAYDWPGNVRELANVIERAVLLCGTRYVQLQDLPPLIAACGALSLDSDDGGALPPLPGSADLAEIVHLPEAWRQEKWKMVREGILLAGERAYITAILQASRGRVGEAAKRAGISSRALFDKMRRHNLRKEDFRV